MADEVRRSGRANKGHHTKNQDALDEPPPASKPKAKGKPDKKSQEPVKEEEEEEEEEEDTIRCVCGDQRDIRGRQMIACDTCEAWQHVKCLGLQEGDEWDERTYYCEQCKPEDHVELLAAMARGEKPWNRKKGSKPAKPKPRASDVKSEGQPDAKPKTPTPKNSTPQPTKEAPAEISNGHSEPKRKETQPKSPIGEKRRRDTTTDKDGAGSKRRKSTAPQNDKAPQPAALASDPAALPDKQRPIVEALIKSLTQLVKEASDSRGFRIPDGQTPSSISTKLALQIDYAAVNHHGAPTNNESPYVAQIRSIMFNTKKNPLLLDRLLSGSLTADGIASMHAEEMASEDKQREYAAMREAAEKQVLLVDEQGPRIRKTHKGEEVVEDDDQARAADASVFTAPERRHRDSVQEDTQTGEAGSPKDGGSPMRVELPEDVGRAPLTIDTSASPSAANKNPPSAFDVKEVWRQVRSPDQQQQEFHRRQSSIAMQVQPQEGPGDDADVDRLLKDEDNDTVMNDYSADPTICWQGTVEMQAVGPFSAVARFVAGGDFGQVIPWNQLLTPTLPIQGRIDKERGNEYITNMSASTTTSVSVLAISPVNDESRMRMDALFQYFHPRNRWGVVPVEKLQNESMRDLYVIPIEAGGSNLPGFLDMLEHCTIETPRPQQLILFALIAKIDDSVKPHNPTPSFEHYPAQEISNQQHATPQHNGPAPSPASRPAPQFSPVTNQPPGQYQGPYAPPPAGQYPPPQVSQYPVPTHRQNPKAVEIFGPFIDEPIVVQILTSFPNMGEIQMLSLRAIMEKVPEARKDMNVLQKHLNEKAEGDKGAAPAYQ